MLFSTGHDICDIIFDFCSCKALTNFAASGTIARESVKFYLEEKLARQIMVYFDRGTTPVASQTESINSNLQIIWIYSTKSCWTIMLPLSDLSHSR